MPILTLTLVWAFAWVGSATGAASKLSASAADKNEDLSIQSPNQRVISQVRIKLAEGLSAVKLLVALGGATGEQDLDSVKQAQTCLCNSGLNARNGAC